MSGDELPRLAALFLVVFDQKVGYTIAWKRSLSDVDLDGTEFKSLPSGLHSVQEDLVYFTHGSSHAGISAFLHAEADEQRRNAKFVCVGALVPLSYGRLGKSWLHAEELRRLAREIVSNMDDREALEQHWKQHQQQDGQPTNARASTAITNAEQPSRKRSRSNASGMISAHDDIPSDHPALSASDLLDSFGPLLLPLYRLALLRKRILILASPPVQRNCNFAYLLSVLSSIPPSCTEAVQPDPQTPLKLDCLFNVGIYDIPFLTEQKTGWLACTTDHILSDKKDLYDVLVKIPVERPSNNRPQMSTSEGVMIKATQRDLRRYRLLRAELERVFSISTRYHDDPEWPASDNAAIPLMRASTISLLQEVKRTEAEESETVEPVTWTAMAYNGFMWWASAGEMEAWENEEFRTDRQLFDDLAGLEAVLPRPDLANDAEAVASVKRDQAVATLITAYFHRLTSQILMPIVDLVESADDDTEEGVADTAISITGDDVRAMGLDSWSTTDKSFAKEMMEIYFRREAIMDANGTRICGVRVC